MNVLKTEKILVVDDHEKITRAYKELLTREGYEAIEAHDSHQATNLLVRQKDVGLILLDIHMPSVDGATLYEVAKLYNPDIKVIVTSADPPEDQRRLIMEADDYFEKTESLDLLLSKVRRVFKQVELEK